MENESESLCRQCGTCCRNGGPALHSEDRQLIEREVIPHQALVPIRLGEPAFSPLTDRVEPVPVELLKVATTRSWGCPFLIDSANQCAIYLNRPLECSLLQCRNTAPLSSIIFKDSLCRRDLLSADDAVLQFMDLHDRQCSFSELAELSGQLSGLTVDQASVLKRLGEIISTDLQIRERAIGALGLDLAQELFTFGRPMFKSLKFYGLTCAQQGNALLVRTIP